MNGENKNWNKVIIGFIYFCIKMSRLLKSVCTTNWFDLSISLFKYADLEQLLLVTSMKQLMLNYSNHEQTKHFYVYEVIYLCEIYVLTY